MKFEIINPSDPYTMDADDLIVAAVAVCLLGNGKYGLDALGEDSNISNNVPIFLLGGHDEWFTSRFGMTYEAAAQQVVDQRTEALAKAFESVALTSGRRSSLNNIGAKAKELARVVRAAR